jgi:exopolyphosphatase/guanosine-5'-triphosphate,3'-diphosphate pyrophosphatase
VCASSFDSRFRIDGCADLHVGRSTVGVVRLGVLDIGSNTVHLLVVDAHHGAAPLPAASHKVEMRLAEHVSADGSITPDGIHELVEFASHAREFADDQGVEATIAFATSAVREAPNGAVVLDRLREAVGLDVTVLSGEDEARTTFLAVRRWFGWSSGSLLVVDIGGGSLELAVGPDEEPTAALSLPLGAGRLTRDFVTSDPVAHDDLKRLRKHVRSELGRIAGEIARAPQWQHAVATSKSLKQLARIAGAAPTSEGPFVPRMLKREDVEGLVESLSAMTTAERVSLPGVSPGRAHQLPAAAVVADAVMDLLGVDVLEVCPWALREGLILRHLDALDDVPAPSLTSP